MSARQQQQMAQKQSTVQTLTQSQKQQQRLRKVASDLPPRQDNMLLTDELTGGSIEQEEDFSSDDAAFEVWGEVRDTLFQTPTYEHSPVCWIWCPISYERGALVWTRLSGSYKRLHVLKMAMENTLEILAKAEARMGFFPGKPLTPLDLQCFYTQSAFSVQNPHIAALVEQGAKGTGGVKKEALTGYSVAIPAAHGHSAFHIMNLATIMAEQGRDTPPAIRDRWLRLLFRKEGWSAERLEKRAKEDDYIFAAFNAILRELADITHDLFPFMHEDATPFEPISLKTFNERERKRLYALCGRPNDVGE